MRGVVRWFNDGRGYGFVVPDGSDGSREQDIFVHRRQIEREPREDRARLFEGQLVELELGVDLKGRCCGVKIRRLADQVGRMGKVDPGGAGETPAVPGTARAAEG